MKDEVLIEVEHVSKKFCRNFKKSLWYGIKDISSELVNRRRQNDNLRSAEFWAVDDISFQLKRGECLGLIGRNGAGKSTLLKIFNGLIKPDRGRVTMRGQIAALIELGSGMNPILTGRENIYVNGSVLGFSKTEIGKKLDEIIEFAEIEEFIDTPVQNYSSGMKVRLGFSIAVQMEPDVFLIDEVLAVGDLAFRSKCFKKLGENIKKSAIVFVSHSTVQVSRICNSVLFLESGKCKYYGNTEQGLELYIDSTMSSQEIIGTCILDDAILLFECDVEKNIISYSEQLKIKLIVNALEDIKTGLCLINISSHEDNVAQINFSDSIKQFNKGHNVISMDINPILLSKNTYYLHVTICDETSKSTLIHGLNSCKFSVEGPRGYGVAHNLPASNIIVTSQ